MGVTGMIFTIVFSLILLILSSSTVGYDYFQFTQQYQPAVCNSNPTPCNDPPDKLFTVHGLWPSNKNGPDPEKCKNIQMNSRKIGNMTAQLEIIWPNVLNRTDHVGFWEREWLKHGTCGYPTIRDDMHYLKTVIKMYITQKQNVSAILSKAMIQPNGKNRSLVDIENAIRSGTNNMKPKFKCQKNSRTTTELVEVTLCSDKDLTKFIDCPQRSPQGSRYLCPPDVQY